MSTLATVMLSTSVFASFSADVTPSVVSDLSGNVYAVLGAIQWIGYAFAIGMLIYIGIKYTMSAANEKADLKRGLINFVIGAVIIAGAATICGWLAEFGQELGN